MSRSINITKATKIFGQNMVFKDLDLSIDKPGLYIISGPSGCGKSTLLNIIAGLDRLTNGHIKTEGKIAMIFQNYELIDELSIVENIFFKRKSHLLKKDREFISKLGIDSFIRHTPKELSFGQRQRVGIARALAQYPDIVLCDEPTESLDVTNKHIVMDMLKGYSKDHIVVIVSHDKELIDQYNDVIYTFKDGKLIKDGHIYDHPFAKRKKIKPDIAYMTFKIVIKRSVIISLVLIISLLGLWSLYSYRKHIFDIPSSTNAICADYIYIQKSDRLEEIRETYTDKAEIILDIPYIRIDMERERANIYPYHEVEGVKIEGSAPKSHEVVINDLYEGIEIGDEIILEINTLYEEYAYSAKVSGIVHEEDAMYSAIYYDLDSILADAKEVDVGDDMTMYDAIIDHPTIFEAEVRYDTISKGYYDDPYCMNPLYDMRSIAKEDQGIFNIVFYVILAIYSFFIFVFIFIFNKRDTRAFIVNGSIIRAIINIDQKILALYSLYKILFIGLALAIGGGLIYILNIYVFSGFITYSTSDHLLVVLFMILVYLFYIITLLVDLKGFKKEKAALYLKQRD